MGKQRSFDTQNSSTTTLNIESLEQRQLYASDLGININAVNAGNYKAIVETLVASGTKGVRLWYGFGDYGSRTLLPVTNYAQKFHNDGFEVTLSVNPSKGRTGTADDTRGLFEFLATQPELKDSVDIWELGNEPDSQKYWRGNLTDFVSDFVAPAARVLHNMGEKVASGGVSWNPKDVKTMVDAGLLSSVDYVGIHPYARTIGALKRTIAELKSYVGGTPLIATEWNLRGHEKDGNLAAWASGVAEMWPIIRGNFAVSHYFVTTVMDSLAGPAGILQTNGRANEPFYSTYMALQDDLNGGTDDGTDDGEDTGTDDGGDTGSDDGDDDGEDTGGSEGNIDNNGDDGEDTSTDSDNDNSTGTGGTKGNGGGTTRPGNTSSDSDEDAGGGGGSKGNDSPTKKPTKTSHDSDEDFGETSGSKGNDSPTKKPTKGRGTSSRPSTPARPTSGTVNEPSTPAAAPVVVTPPELTSISIINAARDRVIKPYAVLSGVNTIDLATTGTAFLSLLASGNRKVGSVVWTINGNTVVDSDGTFTLYGEKDGNLVGNLFEAGRNYVLTVQAFSGENGTGTAGTLGTISLNVIDSGAGTPVSGQELAEQEARRRRAERLARMGTGTVVIPGL